MTDAVMIIINLDEDMVVAVIDPKLKTFCLLGVRAKNVSCATVSLLLVDKVLMDEANKVKSKDIFYFVVKNLFSHFEVLFEVKKCHILIIPQLIIMT